MNFDSRTLAAVVSDQLRKRRQSLGIRQKDLADLAEIAVHTLSNIESGNGNPSLEVLGRLLDCLGLKLTIEPNVPPDAPHANSAPTAMPATREHQ
ncbi:MAG: helix-turn-helix transcriptional regulator [Chthoniobacteraceae bacterium]|jgi:transcriptional regulator with XRE-family HTH domain|nr:helix-turn-helix transcriptional regulator [Chthoniobacteraceae bacterium]